MKLHDSWRHRYRQHRDLNHLSPEDISERMHDCINNLRTRTERNKLGVLPIDKSNGGAWMQWFTEALEECALRKYDWPGPISLAKFKSSLDHAFDPIPDMDQAIKELEIQKNYLLKFGDPYWLKKSYEKGSFRIASAAYYDKQEHNHARRDTELKRFCCPNPDHPDFEEISRFCKSEKLDSRKHWKSVSIDTDYLLFCLSHEYSARLFGDFHATACLIITDARLFMDRLLASLPRTFEGWHLKVIDVKYYDPVRIDPRSIIIQEFKPFKHAYQKEIRIILTPPRPISYIEPVEVEIGPMNEFAKLVDLDSHPSPILPHDPKEDPIQHYGNTNLDIAMLNELPEAKKVQGISLYKEGKSHKDWYFKIQYTDMNDKWNELKIPMLDGLYLMNLLGAAEKEQGLGLWNRP